jgi:hypothetical protein
MVQLGVIAPTKFLSLYSAPYPLQWCFAQVAYSDPTYLEFYKQQSKKGSTVFLDHSTKVPRKPPTFYNTYLSVAYDIQPEYLVLPSVDYSARHTIEAAHDFFIQCSGSIRELGADLVGVLQGIDLADLQQCYDYLKSKLEVSLFALPECLERIIPRYQIPGKLGMKKEYILLEAYNDVVVEADSIRKKKNCMGFVTSFPLRLAYCGRLLNEAHPTPPAVPFDETKDAPLGYGVRNVNVLKTLLEA